MERNSFHFSAYKGNIYNKTPNWQNIDIEWVYNALRNKEGKAVIDKIAALPFHSKAQQDFKAKNLPWASFSGVFSYCNANGLIKHSGLIALDIDDVDNIEELKAKLIQDKELEPLLIYKSPSGKGLKVVVPIGATNAEEHKLWFKALHRYIHANYGIEIDKSCSDVCRASYLSYDPEPWINSNVLNCKDHD